MRRPIPNHLTGGNERAGSGGDRGSYRKPRQARPRIRAESSYERRSVLDAVRQAVIGGTRRWSCIRGGSRSGNRSGPFKPLDMRGRRATKVTVKVAEAPTSTV